MTFNEYYVDKFGDGFTWPELIAMELQRQEDRKRRRALKPSVDSRARQWKGTNRGRFCTRREKE